MRLKLFVAAVVAAAPVAALAASFQLPILADAFVAPGPTNNLVNRNFGGAGGLSVAAPGLLKGEFRSYLRFDAAPAKAAFDAQFGAGDWTIDSVTLSLTATPPNNAIFNGNRAGPGGGNINFAGLLDVEWVSSDLWIEGTGTPNMVSTVGISWANQPGGDELLAISRPFDGGQNSTFTTGLSSSIGFAADIYAGTPLSILLLPADTAIAFTMSSRTGSVPPVLTINAIPEPAAVTIILTSPFLLRRRDGLGLVE